MRFVLKEAIADPTHRKERDEWGTQNDEWATRHWDGVCALSIGLIALAGLRHATGYSRNHKEIIIPVPRSEQEPA